MNAVRDSILRVLREAPDGVEHEDLHEAVNHYIAATPDAINVAVDKLFREGVIERDDNRSPWRLA